MEINYYENLLLFTILLVLWCCSSRELEDVVGEISPNSILENNKVLNLNSEIASKSLVELVRLIKKNDSRYEFNVSKKEALRLGATEEEYMDVI